MQFRSFRLRAALIAAMLTPLSFAQQPDAAPPEDWSSRPPTDNELIAGLREYPLEIVRSLMKLSDQSELLARVSANEQFLRDPDSITPKPDAATLEELKTLVRIPDVIAVAAAHKEPLQRLGQLYRAAPQQWEKRLVDYRLAYRAEQLEAIRAWEQALRSDPVALGQYRDILTAYSKKQQQEFPGFPVATVTSRDYYYACPPSEILFEYLDENRPPEALDNVLIRWFTEYSAPALDAKALATTGNTTLPTPRDVLAVQAPQQRKNMWRIDRNSNSTTSQDAGVGLVPVILQPEGDQPIDARLARAVIEHDRLWSPTWVPNESSDPNAPQTASLTPVDQDAIFDNAFNDDKSYATSSPQTLSDGRVVYDMQPIGQSSSQNNGWTDADWNFNPTPTYQSDLDRVAAARQDFQNDVAVRLGEYGDPTYGTTYVDAGATNPGTTIIYQDIENEYEYDYDNDNGFGWGGGWGGWGGWGGGFGGFNTFLPFVSAFGNGFGWGYPYYGAWDFWPGYNYWPAYNYYYPGFGRFGRFGFGRFGNLGFGRFNRFGRFGNFYAGFWDSRFGYGFPRYGRAYRIGSRFGSFLNGSRFLGRGGGVRYLGRGFRARPSTFLSARGGRGFRNRGAATFGYRSGSRFNNRRGGSIYNGRGNRGVFNRSAQPRGVRQTNRGIRGGRNDGRISGRNGIRSGNRGRIQDMQPVNRGTRGTRSLNNGRRSNVDSRGNRGSSLRGGRNIDARGNRNGVRRGSSSNRGIRSGSNPRGIRESNRGTRSRSGDNVRRISPNNSRRGNSGIRSRQGTPSNSRNLRGTRSGSRDSRVTPRNQSGLGRSSRSGNFNRSGSTAPTRSIRGTRSNNSRSGSSFNRSSRGSSSRGNISRGSAFPNRNSFNRGSSSRSTRNIAPSNRGSRSRSSFNRGSSRSGNRSFRSGSRSARSGSSRGIRSGRSRGIRSGGSRGIRSGSSRGMRSGSRSMRSSGRSRGMRSGGSRGMRSGGRSMSRGSRSRGMSRGSRGMRGGRGGRRR